MRANHLRLALLLVSVVTSVGIVARAPALPATAQGGSQDLTVTTPPVGIHAGTCADFAPEPVYDVGDLHVNTWIGDDWPFIEADLDGDGIAEAERDVNGNGVLDQDEVIIQWTPPSALTLESEIDASFEMLFDSPHVVAVHESDADYATIIACGEMTGIEEDGQIYISLRPINRSHYDGYAVFERDTGNVPVFGENTTGVSVRVIHGFSTSRDQSTTPAGSADVDGDGIANVAEDGYLTEDTNGNAVLDAGDDLDGDGVLDEGIDTNVDGVLTADESFPTSTRPAGSAPTVPATGSLSAEANAQTQSFATAIHQGTCDQLGPVAFTLRELGTGDGNPGVALPGTVGVEEVALVGPSDAVPAWQGSIQVPVQFDTLVASPHAVVVSTGQTEGSQVVACGVIGGRMIGETLMLGLRETNGSGYTGAVLLATSGAETTATILLAATGVAGSPGTPVASPGTPAA